MEKPKGFQEFLTRVWREAWMRLGWNVLELQGQPARLGEEARQGRGKLCRVQLQVNVTSCLNQRWALSQHMMTFAGPWSALLITQEGPSEAKVMNTMFSDRKLRNAANVGHGETRSCQETWRHQLDWPWASSLHQQPQFPYPHRVTLGRGDLGGCSPS